MELQFYKYQGTGNDFIIINNFSEQLDKTLAPKEIEKFCHRRFGVGADGLMILEKSDLSDFKMIYYNSDGLLSSMCGNGGRCISSFAYAQNLCNKELSFEAVDGIHRAVIKEHEYIELSINDVHSFQILGDRTIVMDTGSPHYVRFVDDLSKYMIVEYGREIRFSPEYKRNGINVNLAKYANGHVTMQTYERGVENETLSCGTGVTATALGSNLCFDKIKGSSEIEVITKGGELLVKFERSDTGFENIWLCGEVKKVFEGRINL